MKRTSTKRDAAAMFLRKELAAGPQRPVELQRLAIQNGHNAHTLNSAARSIGVSKKQDANGWLWQLETPLSPDYGLHLQSRPALLPNGPTSNFSLEEIVWWARQFEDHPAVSALLGAIDLYERDLVEVSRPAYVAEIHADAVEAVTAVRDEVLGDMELEDSLSREDVKSLFRTITEKLGTLVQQP